MSTLQVFDAGIDLLLTYFVTCMVIISTSGFTLVELLAATIAFLINLLFHACD